ncbi:MAG: DNA primase [Candidatus Pacebacteria bacterium]|nr:DNA primase [Candidatus Paceibacterota bacterium]
MANFGPELLATLRQRLRLSAVVGRRVKLVKKGRQYQGLCPFHSEKTPSFFVNDDKEFYHCFGCGAHGDVIGFVMHTEGLSFPESVERLAAEAGVELPKSDPRSEGEAQKLNRLKQVTVAATKWFTTQLALAVGAQARGYLTQRGVSEAMRTRFKLGFAPDTSGGERSPLKSHLLKQGFSEAEIIEAGLAVPPSEEGRAKDSYDRFRNRIIFPIHNGRGEVIAFGGRALGDHMPKYLNSPDTPLFSKGNQLYGYDLARAGAKNASALVVEGYLDVIALHQAGFNSAVAPLGTALTEQQLGLLWRMSPEPLLCFDGDSAGQRAANRAAFRALELIEPGRSLRFVALPNGQDPDDLMRSPSGITELKQRIERAIPLYIQVFSAEKTSSPIDTPEQKADFLKRLRERLRDITNPDIRSYYKTAFAELVEAELPRQGQVNPVMGQVIAFNRYVPIARNKRAFFDRYPWRRSPRREETALQDFPFIHDRPNRSLRELELDVTLLYQPLVGLMIRFPTLASAYMESLSDMIIADSRLDSLRHNVVEIIALQPECEVQEMDMMLRDRNQGELINQIFSPNISHTIMFLVMQITSRSENRFDNREIDMARSIVKLLFSELQMAKDHEQRSLWAAAANTENISEAWDRIKASYSDEKTAFDGQTNESSSEIGEQIGHDSSEQNDSIE